MDDSDFVISENAYGRYAVPKAFDMRVVPKKLAAGKVHEPRTLDYIRSHAGDGDVISGGAFVGDFLPAISRALAAGREVHTFEPNPLCLNACRRTITLNDLGNVRLHPVAVGPKKAKLPLRIHDFRKNEPAAAQSALKPGAEANAKGFIEVDVVPLDDLVPEERSVSVLQLDVEGFERQAIRGARRIIRRNRPILIIEGERANAAWLAKLFPRLGYTHVGAWEHNNIYHPATRGGGAERSRPRLRGPRAASPPPSAQ